MALDRVRRADAYDIVALITTVNEQQRRVAMHGVREELIESQAEAIGIPLHKMVVGGQGGNGDYVPALRRALDHFKTRGVADVVFGDIFLEDLRQWREKLLADLGMAGSFPLWKHDTRQLAEEFVRRGFKAVVCCVNDPALKQGDVGSELDERFFRSLPEGVDPCGENGEYHSFVYDGPIFRRPVAFVVGETVYRPLGAAGATDGAAAQGPAIPVPVTSMPTKTKGFWFVDLRLDGPEPAGPVMQ